MICGIILYNPNIKRLKKCIDSIVNQVEKILLVDNNSKNIDEVLKMIAKNDKILIIKNNQNYGIAHALNQILNYAKDNKYSWFLTLDQDSIVEKDLIKRYTKYTKESNVAMICSEYFDDNINKINNKIGTYDDIIEINTCITSGTLNNTDALYKCGGFDEGMFIDCVDFDMCATLKENKYKIIKLNFIGFHHTVGKAQIKKIFNKQFIIYNESPLRLYYYVRNKLYFIKKHKKNINILKNYLSLIKKIFLVIMFEKEKFEKIRYTLYAIVDYKRKKFGMRT